MSVVTALYLVLLAAVTGYVLIGRIPSILHTPMLSGSNFIHGIVLAGAMLALSNASGMLELIIGFLAVSAAAANVVGGFIVTDRMLHLFDEKGVSEAVSVFELSSESQQFRTQVPREQQLESAPGTEGARHDQVKHDKLKQDQDQGGL